MCNVTLGVFCGGFTTALVGHPFVVLPGAVVAPLVGALVGALNRAGVRDTVTGRVLSGPAEVPERIVRRDQHPPLRWYLRQRDADLGVEADQFL